DFGTREAELGNEAAERLADELWSPGRARAVVTRPVALRRDDLVQRHVRDRLLETILLVGIDHLVALGRGLARLRLIDEGEQKRRAGWHGFIHRSFPFRISGQGFW